MNLHATTSQTVGPFLHIGLVWLITEDLAPAGLAGDRVAVEGRVLDGDGKPVNDAMVEIWQAGADGRYGQKGFRGFGRSATDDNGAFRFQTIKPGRVPGPGGKLQAPHIAANVFMRGQLKQLVTRIYFPDDPANGEDPVLALVPAERRSTLIARKRAGKPGALEWNVILQGSEETVFFDCEPVSSHSTSHYFLEGLGEIGVDRLFCNLGTDHAPLIEEMARWRKTGLRHPPTILCPHENVAVHMAAGYTMVTGRGQAVLVHVDAGTANSAMALHNLCRARIPVLLMAGRAPFTVRGELPGSRDNFVHFIQEPFDQAGLVRPYIKWEYDLRSGVTTKEVLRRAHSVMHSDPMGPVYLTLPREVLAAGWEESAVRSFPEERYGPVRLRGTDPQTVAQIAARLVASDYPILVTRYGGRNPAFPALVDELARTAGIRVFEASATCLNIPHDSPCFLGLSADSAVAKADLGLMVDVDVPWMPKDTRENPATYWVHVDVDAIKEKMPMWGFPSDLRVQADSCVVLAQLLEVLRQTANPKFREAAKQRMQSIRQESDARTAGLAKLAAERGAPGRIAANYLCAELGRALSPEDIVFNEGIRNSPTIFNQVPRTRPGSIFGLPGAALGYSGAAALGAKLARPAARAVQVCGDGSFYQCTPETVYAVSKQYELPIMTVVLDNSGWAAVKESTARMYPEGEAMAAGQFEARLAPDMDFSKVAESAGAYGVKVGHPDEVPEAIRRCLAEVRQGRSALLHASIAPF